ncbi:MAG: hypothetical protein OXH31_02850 [Gammaproteobacteria bacterium]|nr:hypothetical protein [Gammaproteobacteria bacterium]
MKRPFIIVFLLFLAGIGVGIISAYSLNTLMSSNGSSKGSSVSSSMENDTTQPKEQEQSSSLGSGGDMNAQVQGLKEILDTFQDENSLDLKAIVFSYVAKVPQTGLGTLLDVLTDKSLKQSSRTRYELQSALLEKLATSHPREALSYAVKNDVPQQLVTVSAVASTSLSLRFALPPSAPTQTSLVTTVFNVWAKTDRAVAVAHAQELDEQSRRLALDGILQSQIGVSLEELRTIAADLGDEQHAIDAYLASFNVEHLDDPRTAWTEVSTLATTRNLPHEWVLKNVVLQWYEQDGVNIVDEIQSSEASANVKSETSRMVLWRAVEDNPEAAFRLALKIPVDMRVGMPYVHDVVRAWAIVDPQAAYNILDEVDDPFLLQILPRAVVSTWAWNDPHYVLDNLADFPPELHDDATASAFGSISVQSPLEAAERALKVSNPRARSEALSQVIYIWTQLDLEAAVSWVESVETTDQQRFQLVDTLTSWLVSDDPLRAFELARNETGLSWNDTGLEADIIDNIAWSEGVDAAVELLDRVREGKTRAVASANVAEIMINNGDTGGALSLGLGLPESEQKVFFPSVARTWAEVDVGNLLEAIGKIPATEVRSKTALKLFEKWRVDNYTVAPVDSLTETQVEVLTQYLSDADRATIDDQ